MPLNIDPTDGNIVLQSDQVTYIHLSAFTASGAMVPNPTGDVDTVASSGPFAASLAFAVGVMPPGSSDPGDPCVVSTPLVLQSNKANAGGNIGLVITDSAGLVQQVTKNFDIAPDMTALTTGLDMTNSFTVSQAAPTAPGP